MLIDYLLILGENAPNEPEEFSPQLNLIRLASLIIHPSGCHFHSSFSASCDHLLNIITVTTESLSWASSKI